MKGYGSLFALGLLSILVFGAYGNSLRAGFVFDDHAIVVENPLIRSLTQIPSLFATGYWDQKGYQTDRLYRPLVMATYALNYATSGLNAFVYHLTNLILHLAVCWMLYVLGRLLGLSVITAFGAAALFAVHPINAEAVTGVVGRAELMMALGVLLAVVFDIECNPLDQPARRVSGASTLAFSGALLSKEQAVMLPVLLLILDKLRLGRGGATWWRATKQDRNRYLVWAAVISAYLLLRYWVLGVFLRTEIGFIENPLAHTDFLTRVMTATKVAGYYLWLVFWPARLSADYSYNAIPLVTSVWNPGMLLGALAWAIVCAAGIFAFRRRDLPLSLGGSMAVLFFAPTSNLIVLVGTIMGERLFYLPFAGLCLVIGAGLERFRVLSGLGNLRLMRQGGIGVFALVLSLLTIRTIMRNRDWQTDFTLFQSAVTVNPEAAKSRFLLGAWLARQGREAEALTEMEKAAAIYPDYPLRHTYAEEMGNLLLAAGRTGDALALVEKALEVSPDQPSLLHLYGLALQSNGQYDEAIAKHERALEVTREIGGENTILFVNGLYDLSKAYAFEGRYREADAVLSQAIGIMDNSLEHSVTPKDMARFIAFRAVLLSTQNDYQNAEPLFRRLLSIIAASANPADFRFLIQPLESFANYLRGANQKVEARTVNRQLDRIRGERR